MYGSPAQQLFAALTPPGSGPTLELKGDGVECYADYTSWGERRPCSIDPVSISRKELSSFAVWSAPISTIQFIPVEFPDSWDWQGIAVGRGIFTPEGERLL